jgi:hypothetical protein
VKDVIPIVIPIVLETFVVRELVEQQVLAMNVAPTTPVTVGICQPVTPPPANATPVCLMGIVVAGPWVAVAKFTTTPPILKAQAQP